MQRHGKEQTRAAAPKGATAGQLQQSRYENVSLDLSRFSSAVLCFHRMKGADASALIGANTGKLCQKVSLPSLLRKPDEATVTRQKGESPRFSDRLRFSPAVLCFPRMKGARVSVLRKHGEASTKGEPPFTATEAKRGAASTDAQIKWKGAELYLRKAHRQPYCLLRTAGVGTGPMRGATTRT